MRILWFCLLLYAVLAEDRFGRPYMIGAKLCHSWKCINDKLGLPYSLPPREQFDIALRALLPDGPWQNVAETVINSCYHNRTRMYTNTCPGQALMHCVVDKLHEFCPESNLRKDDGCSQLTSLSGMSHMFSQSRYVGMKNDIAKEYRPEWFLKHYYESKCCELPPLFNSTVLKECGFDTIIHYYENAPKVVLSRNRFQDPNPSSAMNTVHIVDPNAIQQDDVEDPMDCCDLSTFIDNSWRDDCDFELKWDSQNRLSIKNQSVVTTTPTTTTTPATTVSPPKGYDMRIMPIPCETVTCVFNKLSVLSDTGAVDLDAYTRFLDNFTSIHTEWSKGKARVITECLHKPLLGYDGECEINKMLSCTLDLLSENCPYYDKKTDPCRNASPNNMKCQISSSKYRPKNRRTLCELPRLVPANVLTECDVSVLTLTEIVSERSASKSKHRWTNPKCQESTESTRCLMGKMNVINKYGFMDYFKMKDRIQTASQGPWYVMKDVYMSAFTNAPQYKQYCSSPKKLLNIIDTMLLTCPVSKRKSTPQCNRFFSEVLYASPINRRNMTNERLQQVLTHFQHVFLPPGAPKPVPRPFYLYPTNHKIHYHTNPLYNYGILSSGSAPTVRTIDISPKAAKKPLVILPVYLQMKNKEQIPHSLPLKDGLLRTGGPLSMSGLNHFGH
ncbi:uncharacterized protein ACR2FA_005906 [Aphomia sociella]